MRKFQRVFAIMLLVYFASWMNNLQAEVPSAVKDKLEVFGVGAAVAVKLTNGEGLKGSIWTIGADRFDLMTNHDATPRTIAYQQVAELKLGQSTYRTSGTPKAIEAKRVVTSLGVGRHVGVKLSGHTFRGHIHAIEAEHFVILLDKDGRTLKVSYAEVESLGPNLSKGAKIALGLASAAAAIGISIAVFGTHAGEGPQPTF